MATWTKEQSLAIDLCEEILFELVTSRERTERRARRLTNILAHAPAPAYRQAVEDLLEDSRVDLTILENLTELIGALANHKYGWDAGTDEFMERAKQALNTFTHSYQALAVARPRSSNVAAQELLGLEVAL